MKGNQLGFGIIGCGVISKWHARAVLGDERAVLIGAADRNPKNVEDFVRQFPCRSFASVEELLSCPEIDVVCICTPSGLHAPLAVQAAKAGKHIVVEKPVAITLSQLEEMTAVCQAYHRKVCVISQLRFAPAVRFVKKAIEEGALGDLIAGDVSMKYYRSPEYYASGGWRGTWSMDGGGALMNQGIHGVDLLQYLMGPVRSVSCVASTLRHSIEVEDTANILVEYESGAVGVIQGTTSVFPGYPRLLSLHGTKGSVILKEDTILQWDVPEYSVPEELLEGTSKYNSYQDPGDFTTEYHELQIADMITAILEDREPVINLEEGKKAVELILMSYKAAESGQKEWLNREGIYGK